MVKSSEEIREAGLLAQANYMFTEGSAESGEFLGAWMAAEEMLGERFPEISEVQAEQFLRKYYADHGLTW